MNAKYQLTASALLKKDPVKLRSFQKATDQYRSADITSDTFISNLETLFGKENLESIVQPLIEGLPEKESGLVLKKAFEKRNKSSGSPSNGLFGGIFGSSAPKTPPSPPAKK